MSAYPEHDKMREVQVESQAIGEFLDHSPYTLCEWREDEGDTFRGGQLVPVMKPITQILADWFEIDLDKIEAEKQQMLEELRAMQP